MNIRKSAVAKRLMREVFNLGRPLLGGEAGIVLNSIPKSGTYLAQHMLSNAGFSDYYGFVASTPSLSMKLVSSEDMVSKLRRLLPSELMCGHIFYSRQVALQVVESNTPLIFLYRDPRSIFLSEINYISNMNRWHKCHSYYAERRNFEEQFDLCLRGIGDSRIHYPRFRDRISAYLGWMDAENVMTLRFEDLTNRDRLTDVACRISKYLEGFDLAREVSVEKLLTGAHSRESHTYTGMEPERWRTQLTNSQKMALTDELDGVLAKMGYD